MISMQQNAIEKNMICPPLEKMFEKNLYTFFEEETDEQIISMNKFLESYNEEYHSLKYFLWKYKQSKKIWIIRKIEYGKYSGNITKWYEKIIIFFGNVLSRYWSKVRGNWFKSNTIILRLCLNKI